MWWCLDRTQRALGHQVPRKSHQEDTSGSRGVCLLHVSPQHLKSADFKRAGRNTVPVYLHIGLKDMKPSQKEHCSTTGPSVLFPTRFLLNELWCLELGDTWRKSLFRRGSEIRRLISLNAADIWFQDLDSPLRRLVGPSNTSVASRDQVSHLKGAQRACNWRERRDQSGTKSGGPGNLRRDQN